MMEEKAQSLNIPSEASATFFPSNVPKLRRTPSLQKITKYTGLNPFEPYIEYSQYERIKVILMTITLIAPIRLILIMLLLSIAILISTIATFNHPYNKPLPPWRRFIFRGVPWIARMGMWIAGFYSIKVKKQRGADIKNARLLVSNHVSIWDGFVFGWLTDMSVVCKKELLSVPFAGRLLRGYQALGIERTSEKGRQNSASQLKDRILDKRFPSVLIFPEGTTHNARTLVMFKAGAFRAGVPVQPCVLSYDNINADISYVLDSRMWYLYYSCCQFVNYVSVDFLPQYYPDDKEKDDPILYAGNVRKTIADNLGVTPTEHSYSDIRLRMMAKTNADESFSRIVVDEISHTFHMRSSAVMKLAEIFLKLDIDNAGYIVYKDFCDVLKLTFGSPASTKLFQLFDTDKDGRIGFDEFLAGISAATHDESIEDAIVILFESCDWNLTGHISKQDVKNVSLRWDLKADVESRVNELNKTLFPFNDDEEVNYPTFRKRALTQPKSIQIFLQFLLQQRLGLDFSSLEI